MSEKKFARAPLLYIHQPKLSNPGAPMQYHYITPKNNEEEEEKVGKDSNIPLQQNLVQPEETESVSLSSNNMESNTSKVEDNMESKNNKTLNKRKRFKEMTIIEKIEIFARKPKYTTKLKCEIETEEKTYQGIIVDWKDSIVLMEIGSRASKMEIPLGDIKDVRGLGL